jgi:HD-GYP domain-containing protein (c-di-GMP phosphodiesterase class II)
VTGILGAATAGRSFGLEKLQRAVTGIVRNLAAGDQLLLQALEPAETKLDLPRHMVNTAIFAIKIAQAAGFRKEELPWLGLAGAIHDLGMIGVPRGILEKSGALKPDEMAQVRQHPERGFELLRQLGSEYEWLANVAWQEHEREDGTGYPSGLKGDEIHDYAKIVGLADVYEALTHSRPHRVAWTPFDVMKELITAERTRFPDRLLKGVIHGLSTFPVGSFVRLNSQEVGRIVSTNPALPLRPVIEMVFGPKGERLSPPRREDLSTNTLLYVTEACLPIA